MLIGGWTLAMNAGTGELRYFSPGTAWGNISLLDWIVLGVLSTDGTTFAGGEDALDILEPYVLAPPTAEQERSTMLSTALCEALREVAKHLHIAHFAAEELNQLDLALDLKTLADNLETVRNRPRRTRWFVEEDA